MGKKQKKVVTLTKEEERQAENLAKRTGAISRGSKYLWGIGSGAVIGGASGGPLGAIGGGAAAAAAIRAEELIGNVEHVKATKLLEKKNMQELKDFHEEKEATVREWRTKRDTERRLKKEAKEARSKEIIKQAEKAALAEAAKNVATAKKTIKNKPDPHANAPQIKTTAQEQRNAECGRPIIHIPD